MRVFVGAWVAAVCVLVVGVPVASAADFTWNGQTPSSGLSSQDWSNGTNWVGGTAPSGSAGTLTFPGNLPFGTCSQPQTDVCNLGTNDITGLSADAISIDDGGTGYDMSGNPITVGAGGITATDPSSSNNNAGLRMPIVLGANQTWSIDGGSLGLGGLNVSGVTGSSTLQVTVSHGGFLNTGTLHGTGINGDVEVGALSIVGANSAMTGANAGVNGVVGPSQGLNGTNGKAINLTDAAMQPFGSQTIGPLRSAGGQLVVGLTNGNPRGIETLTVNGGVTLDSASEVVVPINGGGTTAGVNYSQLSASGAVTLAGGLSFSSGVCPAVTPGQVYTLITTSGSLSGTFAGVPDGTVIAIRTAACTPPMVRINYTAHSVTATVVPSTTATTTTLSTSSPTAVTNQPITLTATVGPNSASPTGTVEFDNNGTPVAGCSSQPVSLTGSAYTATCSTSFTAASSPEALTAVFTSSSPTVQESTSSPDQLTVGKDSSTTMLGVSNASPTVGQDITYTATVAAIDSGATQPSGSVQFLDGRTPIGSCSSQLLAAGSSSSTATCTVAYGTVGSHSITAAYLGDGNFSSSASTPQGISVHGISVSASVTVAQIKAGLLASITPSGKLAKISSILKLGGFVLSFNALEAGTAIVSWYSVPKGAHVTSAHHNPKPVLVATGRLVFTGPGASALKVKLTTGGKNLFKHAKTLKLTAKGTFMPSTATTVSTTKTFRLRR